MRKQTIRNFAFFAEGLRIQNTFNFCPDPLKKSRMIFQRTKNDTPPRKNGGRDSAQTSAQSTTINHKPTPNPAESTQTPAGILENGFGTLNTTNTN